MGETIHLIFSPGAGTGGLGSHPTQPESLLLMRSRCWEQDGMAGSAVGMPGAASNLKQGPSCPGGLTGSEVA